MQKLRLVCGFLTLLLLVLLPGCRTHPLSAKSAKAKRGTASDLDIVPLPKRRQTTVWWNYGDVRKSVKCCTKIDQVYLVLLRTSFESNGSTQILEEKFNKKGSACIKYNVPVVQAIHEGTYTCLVYIKAVYTTITIEQEGSRRVGELGSSSTTMTPSYHRGSVSPYRSRSRAGNNGRDCPRPSYADVVGGLLPLLSKKQIEDTFGLNHVEDSTLSAIRLSKSFIDIQRNNPSRFSGLYDPSLVSACPEYRIGTFRVTRGSYKGYEIIKSAAVWKCYLQLCWGPAKKYNIHLRKQAAGTLRRILVINECAGSLRILLLNGNMCYGDCSFAHPCATAWYYQL